MGVPPTRSVELTLQAERKIAQVPGWEPFFRKAIAAIAVDPEPDGVSQLVAPIETGYSGCILADRYPWRIFYQLAAPHRLIIVAIEIHPARRIHM